MKKSINGFELVKEEFITELNTKGRLFRHEKTGARLLSLENEDDNKVFGITFRTPPHDSTGVAHIMEHSVLCGSRKYPLKEPFVELMKSSLNTFLNAFTYPDKTCYPLASQNVQDFYNLIDVYLDAVFYPLISPYTFQQEAWHYELEHPDDELKFKGVVFNEMKGVYSSSDSMILRKSQQYLFPDNTYGFDSGGDPAHIPDLSYEAFKKFHQNYYHPSNAYIYFYGDDDPQERLRIMNAYLHDFEAQAVDSQVELQSYLESHPRLEIPYDAGTSAGESKAFVTVNWLLPEVIEAQVALSFMILAEILIGSPASPLRKVLIDSGLGEDLTGQGLEADLRQMFFSTGLKGVSLSDTEKVEGLIFETLDRLAQDGIDANTLAAALNTVEFRLRENNTGRYPQGLLLMIRALRSWLHGRDPFEPLAFEAPLRAIKDRLVQKEPYFESMIQEHFLQNLHRTTVILKPDPEEGKRRAAGERERLEQARSEMPVEQLQEIVLNTRELKRRQEAPDPAEALATIPTLELPDLDRGVKRIPLEEIEAHQSKILFHNLFTNGILYLDAGFDLTVLPQELLPYVNLFGRALLEMGTDKEDYVQLSQRIGRSTGGIRPATYTSLTEHGRETTAWLFLRAKASVHQTVELLDILRDVMAHARFDRRERFRQILLEEKANLEQQLLPMGHRVVNGRIRAYFNPADWAAEQMGGISYLLFLRQLVERLDRDWPDVLEKLDSIHQHLFNRKTMVFNVTLDKSNWQEIRSEIEELIHSCPFKQSTAVQWKPELDSRKNGTVTYEGLTLPAQVNYVGKGANLYPLGYGYDGSMAVAINVLRNTWLWEKVRVQGGAYGGMCAFDHRTGIFTLLSYRDPNLLETLDIYDHSGEFLRQLDLSPQELTKSIIGAIGEMDAFLLPDAKGYVSMQRYLAGDSDEKRQIRRDEIFAASLDDFRALGTVLDRMAENGQVVVLGSKDSLRQLESERSGANEVVKIRNLYEDNPKS